MRPEVPYPCQPLGPGLPRMHCVHLPSGGAPTPPSRHHVWEAGTGYGLGSGTALSPWNTSYGRQLKLGILLRTSSVTEIERIYARSEQNASNHPRLAKDLGLGSAPWTLRRDGPLPEGPKAAAPLDRDGGSSQASSMSPGRLRVPAPLPTPESPWAFGPLGASLIAASPGEAAPRPHAQGPARSRAAGHCQSRTRQLRAEGEGVAPVSHTLHTCSLYPLD